jgi:hypothetical protein
MADLAALESRWISRELALGDTQIRPMGDSKNPANEIEKKFVPGDVDRHAFPYLGTPSPNPWDLSLCRQKVDGIDVVHAFASLPVALMHGVHAQVPGPAVRLWPSPLADGHLHRPGRLISNPPLPVRAALSQRYSWATDNRASR